MEYFSSEQGDYSCLTKENTTLVKDYALYGNKDIELLNKLDCDGTRLPSGSLSSTDQNSMDQKEREFKHMLK